MADELPYHRVTTHLDIPLHRRADVTHAVACGGHLDALVQTLAGGVHQRLSLCGNAAGAKGGGVVSVEAVVEGAHVNADDVALTDDTVVGYAVDNHVVD